MIKKYTTKRTGRKYLIRFSEPGMYSGTYYWDKVLKDLEEEIAEYLGVVLGRTIFEEDRKELDWQELVTYCMLELAQNNITMKRIKLCTE